MGGDEGTYRSTVNFGNGVRLLGSSLSMQSREGHGRYFDLLQLNTQGLGNDPYQSAVLRVQKNSLYRYDMMWRLNEYYNPGLITALVRDLIKPNAFPNEERTREARKAAAEFFDKATPDSFRQDLLSRYNIKYVFYGPEERNIGAYDPSTSTFLTPVFRNGKVAIFRVTG